MEMALVRLGRLDDLVSLAQVAQWLTQPGAAPLTRPAGSPTVALPENVKKKVLNVAESQTPAGPLPLTEESLPRVWQAVLAQIGRLMATPVEKAGLPAIFAPNTLVLRFDGRYNVEREHCSEPSRIQRIEETLRRITEQPWQLRIESIGSGAGAAVPEAAVEATTPQTRSRLKRAEAVQGPLLKRAVDVLGAQVVHVDDNFGSTSESADVQET
jgi:hypothetical protein